jgi:gliding motility-associated-like protein
LPNYDTQILDTQSSLVFEVFYFESETDALSSLNVLLDAYIVNSTSQTIFARIENKNHPECFEITSFEIGVNYSPVAYTPENLNLCDFGNDGSETIDLTNQDESVLNGQSATNNIISYYLTSEDAEAGLNAQSNNFTKTSNPQTIYTRIENSNSSECYAVTSFEIILNEQPELLMDDIWPICEVDTVDVIADEGYDYYTWDSGQTTRIITVDEPGIYTVIASNVYGNLTCSAEKTITVNISDIAIITDIETEDWSQSNNSISVFAEGNGEYEYSIDGINYQDVNIFNGLSIDDYTIYVRDKNGCGIVSEDVYLLYYPRFFTPNGDGNNDFWQIKNSAREPLNKLYIYNRYGKLITQLKPNDYGWDGTLNGSKLPSSDYWFVLERQNGKIYNGHFTLKR